MAETVTVFSPLPMSFPFLGLDQLGIDRSNVPRAEIVYTGLNQVITAGGVGNTQRVAIACAFPRNFSYGLAEVHVSINVATGQTMSWNLNGVCIVVDASTADGRTLSIPLPMLANGIADAGNKPQVLYNLDADLKTVVVPQPNTTGAQLSFGSDNPVENAPEATMNFFIRLYQYDIEQAHHYAVNTPTLVR